MTKRKWRKLTTRQVHEIREKAAQNHPRKVIAWEYSVSERTVTDVVYGRTYAHVAGALPEPPFHSRVSLADQAAIRTFMEAGGTIRSAVTTFGRCKETIYRYSRNQETS